MLTDHVHRVASAASPFSYVIVDTSTSTRTCIHTPGATLPPERVPSLDPAGWGHASAGAAVSTQVNTQAATASPGVRGIAGSAAPPPLSRRPDVLHCDSRNTAAAIVAAKEVGAHRAPNLSIPLPLLPARAFSAVLPVWPSALALCGHECPCHPTRERAVSREARSCGAALTQARATACTPTSSGQRAWDPCARRRGAGPAVTARIVTALRLHGHERGLCTCVDGRGESRGGTPPPPQAC